MLWFVFTISLIDGFSLFYTIWILSEMSVVIKLIFAIFHIYVQLLLLFYEVNPIWLYCFSVGSSVWFSFSSIAYSDFGL